MSKTCNRYRTLDCTDLDKHFLLDTTFELLGHSVVIFKCCIKLSL